MNTDLHGLEYRQVDVFSNAPLSGNGLSLFWDCDHLSAEMMLKITQEMRQFESIFITKQLASHAFRAHIFTEDEELDFAGHPILGAAAAIHEKYGETDIENWQLHLNKKVVDVRSERLTNGYRATMNQGQPIYMGEIELGLADPFLKALNLDAGDVAVDFPLAIISTGLPYLIVPVQNGLERAQIITSDFESLLATVGAKFVYVLDVENLDGRTWDNDGRVEDIATGSAAGPVGAYLFNYGQAQANETFVLNQGRFVGRPSQLEVKLEGVGDQLDSIYVSGQVIMVAKGIFD